MGQGAPRRVWELANLGLEDEDLSAEHGTRNTKNECHPTTTVIIPAYNEEQGLPIVLEGVFEIVDASCEVLVVNDGSGDGTAEVASRFPCRLINHEVNKGKGEALKTGIKNARGENIIWIDADDTYPVEVIPQMVEALETYDIVIGSRVRGRDSIPAFNRIGIWIFRNIMKRMHGFSAYDPCSGLCGVKKHYLEQMELSSRGFAIEPEICVKASRMKLKMLDIPIEYRARVGDSKLSAVKVGFEDLWTILRLIPWRPSKDGNG